MPVDTARADYTAKLASWKRCRDVAEGSDAVKGGRDSYLPRLSGQTTADYDGYVDRAFFYNATGRTVQGLAGIAFQQDPTVTMPDGVKAAITEQLADVTLAGQPFFGFASTLVKEILNPGRYGVLVDFHEDTDAEKARPYWVAYRAEQIINWEEAQRGGDTVLTLVVISERRETRAADGFGIECKDRYRVLDLDEGGKYRVRMFELVGTGSDKAWLVTETLMPTRRGERLTFIPFVFFGPHGVTTPVEKPPLLDLVDANLSHYRTSADYEHGCHFTGLPQPVITGASPTAMKIGSSEAWVLPAAEAKAFYLEFNGQGLSVLERNLERKEEIMARLGGRLLEGRSSKQEAAETVKTRYAGDSATLQTIVGAASLGLTMILRWHIWWNGADVVEADVAVAINNDFFSMDLSADEVKAAVLDYQAGGMSFETFYWKMQRGGWARPGVDAAAEKALIDAEMPKDPAVDPNAPPAPNDGLPPAETP